MPNSTALSIADTVLNALGLEPIGTVEKYDDRVLLDKYQLQAKIFIDLTQRKFGIKAGKRFMWRTFTIDTVVYDANHPVTAYPIPGIIEGLKPNSFFNVTANGVANSRLFVATYEQWRDAYPRPDQVAPGYPVWIVPMPDDGTGVAKLMPFPYASAVYQIEGQCRLVVKPIMSGNDQIIFPPHYEHALIFKTIAFLEGKMNEGRDVNAEVLADEAIQEVLQDATGADEEIEPIDFGMRLWSPYRDSTRDFNPATDIAPPFP